VNKTDDVRARVLRELDRLVPAATDGERPGLLVALSGGSDSTALLLLAHAWAADRGAALAAAHYNHRLRGAEADGDETFCRDLCRDLGVPLRVEHAPENLDDASENSLRTLRRGFLLRVLDHDGRLAACATGHHRDDQNETLLMRLFRGTGPDGFRGIPERSVPFVRPLLTCGRDELQTWLTDRGRTWRDDASNADGDNLRARMRRDLWPVLHDLFGPAVDRGPARFAALIAADAAELDRQARAVLDGWRNDGLEVRCLPLQGLLDLPRPLGSRLVRLICSDDADQPGPLEASHVERALTWPADARSGSRMELSGGWSVVLEFETLRFHHENDIPDVPAWRLETRDATDQELRNPLPECGLTPDSGHWALTCPRNAARGELRIRPWNEGERMRPLGMAGRKKISDLLQEHRVPASARSRVPIVVDDDGPLWLVGLCRDERTRLLPSTTRGITLLVDVHPGDGDPDEA